MPLTGKSPVVLPLLKYQACVSLRTFEKVAIISRPFESVLSLRNSNMGTPRRLEVLLHFPPGSLRLRGNLGLVNNNDVPFIVCKSGEY